MKNLKFGLLSLLAVLAVSVFLTSCEQEDIIEETPFLELEESEELMPGDLDDPTMTIEFPEDMEHPLESRVDGINGYQWWDITRSNVHNLDSRIRPTVIGNNTFFASGGKFNNGQGWYIGLQQKGNGIRTLHAAIWDSNRAIAGSSASCSNFSGEGVGKKCWRYYNWSTLSSGYYRLRISRLHEDNYGRWWGFWVIAPNGIKYHIGNIRADKDADYIKNNNSNRQDHFNFIENWSHGSYPTCSQVPDARYYVYWPRFNYGNTGSTRVGTSEENCVDAVKYSSRTKLEIGL